MVTTNYPNFRLHRLQGKLSKYHSIVVDRNWRLIFKYTDEGIELIDYVDYH